MGWCLWGEELAGLRLQLEFGEFLRRYAADYFDDSDDEFVDHLDN